MRLTKAGCEVARSKFGGRGAYCGAPLNTCWYTGHFEALRRNDWFKFSSLRTPEHPACDQVDCMMPKCVPCNIDRHPPSLEVRRRKFVDVCGVLTHNQPTYRHEVRSGLVRAIGAPVIFHVERMNTLPKRHAAKNCRQLSLDKLRCL